MKEKTATVLGGTGLIGGHLLELLQGDPDFKLIKALVRRPAGFRHPKIREKVIDFTNGEEFKAGIAGSEVVFCAVGTTNKKVKGDKDAYRKVDYDIPVHAARYCAETGCPHFVYVSSVGADSRAGNFYIRLKGEVEDAVSGMNIGVISVFRPSMLMGNRQEKRAGEQAAKILMQPVAFLVPSRFRPVSARVVAKAMIAASKKHTQGIHVYHYRDMMDLIA